MRNPRVNDKTVKLLVNIIPKVGFNVPLVIDKNGIIVKGHARFNAGIKLGMTELPCVITDADEEAIKADRITDNKISEFSEWINDELLHELDMIDLDINFEDFGLPTPTFDDIPSMEDFMMDDEDEKKEVSDEQKKKLYQEFLEKQAKEQATEVSMTTENAIKKATAEQKSIADAPPKYYKCVCEKCGHTMFVDAKDLWNPISGSK